ASCTRAGTTSTRISRSSRDWSTITAKRCVLNVATGPYAALQLRLAKSLADQGWSGGLLTWTDRLPAGSPAHDVAPYAFKLYAISEALTKGFTSLLCLDAPCVAARPLDPVFQAIQREGHGFVTA